MGPRVARITLPLHTPRPPIEGHRESGSSGFGFPGAGGAPHASVVFQEEAPPDFGPQSSATGAKLLAQDLLAADGVLSCGSALKLFDLVVSEAPDVDGRFSGSRSLSAGLRSRGSTGLCASCSRFSPILCTGLQQVH